MIKKYHKAISLMVACTMLLMLAGIMTACRSTAPRNAGADASSSAGSDTPIETSVSQELTPEPTSTPTPEITPTPSPTLPTTPEPNPVPTLSPEEAEWVGRYGEVLSQYKDVMAMHSRGYDINFENLGSFVNENVIMGRFPGWTVYYALYDIDDNAIPELIIKGGPAEDTSQIDPALYTYETQYDIFTYKDGDVINVFKDNYKGVHIGNLSFGFKFYFTLQNDRVIAVYASVGTGSWIEEFYRLSSGGYAEFIEGVFFFQLSGDPVIYRRYTDLTDTYSISNPEITEDECYDLIEKYFDIEHKALPDHKLQQRENGAILDWIPLIR